MAHWKAFLNETNKLVEDTRLQQGDDHPIEVRVGNFAVTKCLDVALAQMVPG